MTLRLAVVLTALVTSAGVVTAKEPELTVFDTMMSEYMEDNDIDAGLLGIFILPSPSQIEPKSERDKQLRKVARAP